MARAAQLTCSFAFAVFAAMFGLAAPAHATDVSAAVRMCEDRGPDCVHHTDGAYTYINVDNGENGQQQIICSNTTGDCTVRPTRTRPRRPPRRGPTPDPAHASGVDFNAPVVRFSRSN